MPGRSPGPRSREAAPSDVDGNGRIGDGLAVPAAARAPERADVDDAVLGHDPDDRAVGFAGLGSGLDPDLLRCRDRGEVGFLEFTRRTLPEVVARLGCGPVAARIRISRCGTLAAVPPRYDPKAALVVVDVQNDFADPQGSLFVQGAASILPMVNSEARLAREAGALVVYTQDWHPESTPHFAKDGGIWPVHCVGGTWGADFHPALDVDGPTFARARTARTATPASR